MTLPGSDDVVVGCDHYGSAYRIFGIRQLLYRSVGLFLSEHDFLQGGHAILT